MGGGGGARRRDGSIDPPTTPYTPFENSAVGWASQDSETAAPAVSQQGGGSKPAVLLFIGKEDAENCCAQTFEREVFLDGAVLELAPSFVMIRLDRLSEKAKPWQVKKPAIVVVDSEADTVGRYDECCDPLAVAQTMKEAISRQKTIEERTAELAPRFPKAEKLLQENKVRECSSVVAPALRAKHIKKTLRDKFARLGKDLDDLAAPRIETALAKDAAGDPGLAWTLLRDVKNDFLGLPSGKKAEAAMHALERDTQKKGKLREFKAESAFEAAKVLAEQGKKAEAITALRSVGNEFPGSQAADAAKAYMKEIQDPSWSPKPKASGHDDSVDEPSPASTGHDDSVDDEPSTGGK